jgi:glycosyl transferase family 87
VSESRAAALFAPRQVGRLTLPSPLLVVLAAVGAVLLVVVAVNRWAVPSDEHAYWLASQRLLHGEPLYDPTATIVTPYAYWYPPVLAQVLAPVAAILPSEAFTAAWTVLLLVCIWFLAGRSPLGALALIAFLPVAVELWFRNIHLVLAVLVVLGLRRWPALFAVGASIKLAPGLGIVYLAARGRWRDASLATAVGIAILVVSIVVSPDAWRQFADILSARGAGETNGFLAVPYFVRAAVGLALAVVAGRIRPAYGEPLLIVAITVALPTLWFTALSMLAAMVGLWLLKPVPETEVVAAGAAPDPRPDALPARTR